ncbi:MAG: IS607 family transposase [Candidatus Parabeggiatoa sp. nov. 1]|nr:MAG: IS607 family transposase [Gammaproteobacteria bacterium]
MKLSQWAKNKGIDYRTAWEHYRCGKIPGAYQLKTGTIIVPEEVKETKAEFIVTYARVSSSENQDNLEKPSERLIQFCNALVWQTHLNLKEIGSGLNESRPKLNKVLKEGKLTKLVVEHKDRLARFGVKYIYLLCHHIDCEVIILNNQENDKEDLIQDFVSVITSFCARIYGQRRSKRKTEQLIKELNQNGEVKKN